MGEVENLKALRPATAPIDANQALINVMIRELLFGIPEKTLARCTEATSQCVYAARNWANGETNKKPSEGIKPLCQS